LRRDKNESSNVQALIESLRSNLPVSVTLCHDRFRAAGKRSVAEVRHGVCAGCHMVVPVGALADLKRGDGLHRCGSCGRYIYLVEEEESDRQPVRRAVNRAAALNRA
jgi:predicted  nucleic acid-binding Zn-ribbon protein